MTKRGVEREIDKLETEILAELDADDRLALSIRAIAAGREDHVSRLKRTAPVWTYRMSDIEFREGMQESLRMSSLAWHELERGVWRFYQARIQGHYHEELARHYDTEDWEFLEEPSEENDYLEGPAMDAAASFLADYRTWKRFAAERYDGWLQEFLAVATPQYWIDTIEEMAELAYGRMFDDDGIGGWAAGRTVTVDGDERSVDEAAEYQAEQLLKAVDGIDLTDQA